MADVIPFVGSIVEANQDPKRPRTPQEGAAKQTVKQRQLAARAQGMSSLILTRGPGGRAALGVPGNAA
jgi:hypothetical protein